MAKSLKNYRKQLKDNGVFYTDPKLAEKLKSYFPTDITEIYDPTCGCGNLLSVFPDFCKKYGQELDPDEAEEARKNLTNCEIVSGDTLLNDGFKGKKFKYIVANPPFSVKWQPDLLKEDIRFKDAPTIPTASRADFAFLLHILHHLTDDGIAVVLNSPGVLHRGNREGKIRRWMVEKNYIEQVELIPSGYFEDTNIQTALLIIKKNRTDKDTTIKFIHNETNEEKITEISKILEDENSDLSVHRQTYKFVPLRSSEEILTDFCDTFLKSFKLQLSLLTDLQKDKLPQFIKEVDNALRDYKHKVMDIDLKSVFDWINEETKETECKLEKAIEKNDMEIIKDCQEKLNDLKEELDELKREFIRRKVERKQLSEIKLSDLNE